MNKRILKVVTEYLCVIFVTVFANNAYTKEEFSRFYLNKAQLSSALSINEEELSCDFLNVMTNRILEVAQDFSLTIIPIEEGTPIPKDEYVINITIEGFDQNYVQLRPDSLFASSLSVHAEISKNGKSIRTYDRRSASGRMFNSSCGRLENAAEYLGVAITKWVAKAQLDYLGPDIRNYVLEEDILKASMEDAINYELFHYANIVEKGAIKEIKGASTEILVFAIDDIRLHDEIEKIVLSDYENPSEDNLPKILSLTMMLGYSGNAKYLNALGLIEEKTQSKKLKAYAAKSIVMLKQQAIDKLKIQTDIDKVKPAWRFQKRISNMIMSGNYVMGVKGVKYAMKYYPNDEELIAVAKQYVADNYARVVEDKRERKQFVKLMGVLMRYLVASPIHYQSMLVKISKEAGEDGVKSIAKKYLKQFQ